jgi:hypothetical protein
MALASLCSAMILSILSNSETLVEPRLFLLELFSVTRVTREAWVAAHRLHSAIRDLIIPTTRCSLRDPLTGYRPSTASTRSSPPDVVSALLPETVNQQLGQLAPSRTLAAQDPAQDPNALLLKSGTRTILVLGRPKERRRQTPPGPVQAVHLHLPRVCRTSRPSTPLRMLWRVIWEIRVLRAIWAIQAVQATMAIKFQQEEVSKRCPCPRRQARTGEAFTGTRGCLTNTSPGRHQRLRE